MSNNSSKIGPSDSELLWRIFCSDKTGDKITDVCRRNDITGDEKQKKFIETLRAVFLGLLPPQYFQRLIESELDIDSGTAERIYSDVNNLIFYQNREILDRTYRGKSLETILGVEKPEEEVGKKPEEKTKEKIEEKPKEKPEEEEFELQFQKEERIKKELESELEKKQEKKKTDVYRELID